MVICETTCRFQSLSLFIGKHSKGTAYFQTHIIDLGNHIQNPVEIPVISYFAPCGAHAETARTSVLGLGSRLQQRGAHQHGHVGDQGHCPVVGLGLAAQPLGAHGLGQLPHRGERAGVVPTLERGERADTDPLRPDLQPVRVRVDRAHERATDALKRDAVAVHDDGPRRAADPAANRAVGAGVDADPSRLAVETVEEKQPAARDLARTLDALRTRDR